MNWHDTLQAVKQKAFPRTHALECELADLRDEHARVIADFDSVRGELSQTREQDAQQLASLQQQLTVIEYERRASQDQARLLEKSLADAAARQRDSEQHVKSLEAKLDDTRNQYESGISLTQEALLRMQSEQQGLLALQTNQVKSFHEVGKRLLESSQAQPPRKNRLQATAMAGLLFLSGALVSGMVMRNNVHTVDLTPIQDGIVDLQRMLGAHFETQDELLKLLSDKLGGETANLEESRSIDDPPSRPPTATPKRLIERQRSDLALLGFETDGEIDSVLARFRTLYLPAVSGQPGPSSAEVDAALGHFADQARKDSRQYQVDGEVLAAIRLASKRTGVEFSFLMELAATESSFNPAARAPTSTAAGLFQFKEDTWLDTIKLYGHKYGLDAIKQRIEYVVDSKGVRQPTINDPDLRAEALGLRLEPRLSALLAAEQVRRNKRQLISSLDRKPGRTDLYLTHFFGATGAISFLKALAENPQKIAGDIFPGPARRNRSIFHDKARKPRTVAEIYRLFARKFNTDRFRDGESG